MAAGAQSVVPAAGGVRPPRLDSVDYVRGLVMVLMALDHTRDYFSNFRLPPEFMQFTNGTLFFTRWLTHFCAPTFFMLAGTGIFLSSTRGRTPEQIAHFCLTRGLWLIFCELVIVNTGWLFAFFPIVGLTIWALGWSMVAMSVIVRLPLRWVAAIGLIIVFTHNLFDTTLQWQLGPLAKLWPFLHVGGPITLLPSTWQLVNGHLEQTRPLIPFIIGYPMLPWLGVMASGYALGRVMLLPTDERRGLLLRMGAGLTLLFVLLRATNLYGNPPQGFTLVSPGPFEVQYSAPHVVNWVMTTVSFFNTEKYPPSLLYLLMTLGPILMLLAWADRWDFGASTLLARFNRAIVIYGRVPMFYYILHIYWIHILAVLVAMATGQDWHWLFGTAFFTGSPPQGYGHGLLFVYAVWIFAVASLYPLCKWYAGVKARRKDWWLSYL